MLSTRIAASVPNVFKDEELIQLKLFPEDDDVPTCVDLIHDDLALVSDCIENEFDELLDEIEEFCESQKNLMRRCVDDGTDLRVRGYWALVELKQRLKTVCRNAGFVRMALRNIQSDEGPKAGGGKTKATSRRLNR